MGTNEAEEGSSEAEGRNEARTAAEGVNEAEGRNEALTVAEGRNEAEEGGNEAEVQSEASKFKPLKELRFLTWPYKNFRLPSP